MLGKKYTRTNAKQFVLNGDTDIERYLFYGISQCLLELLIVTFRFYFLFIFYFLTNHLCRSHDNISTINHTQRANARRD